MLWAACSVGLALMGSTKPFFLWRFLLGASEAGLVTDILLYLTGLAARAIFTAPFMASIPISGILGGPISEFIMRSMEDLSGFHSWQWLFPLEGLPPLVLVFVVMRLLHDEPSKAPWISADKAELIEHDLQADRDSVAATEHKSFAKALLSPRSYLLASMGVALLANV